MTKVFSFQVPDNLYNALEKVAVEIDRSKGYIVRQLVEQYILDHADLEYAEKVSKEIDSKKTKLIDWKDIKKKYGLEN